MSIVEIARLEIVPACALLAAMLASFGAVLAERIPRGESIRGRSHCVCGEQLKPRHLIPILSWLATSGRARCCDTAIPTRYVLSEVAMAVLGAVIGLRSRVEMAHGAVVVPLIAAAAMLAVSTTLLVLALRPRIGAH
jgi:prepilin signal peptidase PulO-like enzyme (type II secretory pathway)